MNKWILFFVFLLPICVIAQKDSIDILQADGPEAIIVNTISQSRALEVKESDLHIANLLSRSTGIQIQGQGGSYLRTALYRGQAARHMAIMWEGINIQNQFNGTYDLGLVPAILFNNSKWYDGNFSAAIGTAAMSGALVLSDSNNRPKISIGMLLTDQSNAQYNLKLGLKNGKVRHTIGMNVWDNANKFRYKDGQEIFERIDSEHSQKDFTYTSRISWSQNVQSKFSYWYQDVERSLPSSIIASNIANQNDINHRFSLSNIWQSSKSISLSTSLGYMYEYLGYFQPGINSESKSDILNFNGKLSIDGGLSHVLGFNVRYENGELQDTINPSFASFFPTRTTTAVYYNVNTEIEKSIFNFSLRQELIGKEFQLPVGQVSYKYNQNKELSYKLSLGSSFNYPGFNDLYWPMGGNPDLQTEKSYQIEFGMSLRKLKANLYWIATSDKIVWAPNEQNIWMPDNISSTSTRGVELEYLFGYTSKELELQLIPMLNYNHTINKDEGQNIGKQLLYNPKLNYRLNINASIKDWMLSINHSYTSERFQSLDNSSALDPYQLLDAELLYQFQFGGKYTSKIHLGVKNIFDQSYELVRFFPQPLRSIYFGTKISIQ